MAKPWIVDRTDPRTVLTVSLVALAVGVLVVPALVRAGGAPRVFGLVWLAVAVVQAGWAGARVLRLKAGETPPQP